MVDLARGMLPEYKGIFNNIYYVDLILSNIYHPKVFYCKFYGSKISSKHLLKWPYRKVTKLWYKSENRRTSRNSDAQHIDLLTCFNMKIF